MESGNFEWLKESEKVVLASRVQPLVSSINLKQDISNRCLADTNKQSIDFISKIHDLISAQGTMGRVKGTVSLLLFPLPRLLVTQRDLCGEEKNTEL